MIGSVRGTLLEISSRSGPSDAHPEVLVEAAGVGYRLFVSAGTAAALGSLGSEVFLHVHTRVREDAIVLYGFGIREERECFEALIAAHGVGPGAALSILSVHSPSSLRRALVTDDVDALVAVPGIGKKTAARMLIDLKARLELPDLDLVTADSTSGGNGSAAIAEVRAALAGLGYGPDEIRHVVQTLDREGSSEELLRAALRQLAAVP